MALRGSNPHIRIIFWSNYFISAWHATIPLHHGIPPINPFQGLIGTKGRKPDFAKTQGRKIRFGVSFYLGESSEADIQPSLYNQTFSIIFQASQFF